MRIRGSREEFVRENAKIVAALSGSANGMWLVEISAGFPGRLTDKSIWPIRLIDGSIAAELLCRITEVSEDLRN
jgi:hypothetical protein